MSSTIIIEIITAAFVCGWHVRGIIALSREKKLLDLLQKSFNRFDSPYANFTEVTGSALALLNVLRRASMNEAIAKHLSAERPNPFSEHGPN